MKLAPGGGARLVQLRNPWGQGVEWRGEWSHGSQLWTPRLCAASQPKREPGVFWMGWRDFVRYFSAVDVCRVRPAWRVLRVHASLPSRPPPCAARLEPAPPPRAAPA